MSDARRSWVKASLAMLALSVAQRATGLVSVMILARVLDPRGLGAYTFTQSVAQSIAGWTRFGLDAGTHVTLAGELDRERTARLVSQSLTLALAIAILGAACLVAAADVITGRLFRDATLAPFVRPAAVVFFGLTLFGVIYAIHAGLGTFAAYARNAIGGTLATLALSALGAATLGSLGAAWGLAAGQMITTALAAHTMRRVLAERDIVLVLAWPGREVRDLLARGLPYFAATLFALPADFAAMSVLARTEGVEVLGELRITQAIMSAVATLPSAVMGPLMTSMTIEYAHGSGEQQARRQIRLLWILALATAIVLAGVWPLAIDAIAGQAYPLARGVGALALMAFVPATLLSVLHGALMARGKSSTGLLVVGAIHAAAMFTAAWLLIPRYGLAGYLVAQAIGFVAASVVAAIAWGGNGAIAGPRVGLLAGLTLALYAALVLDLVSPSSMPVRVIACLAGTAIVGGLACGFLLHKSERDHLTSAAAATWRRLRHRRAHDDQRA